MFYWYHLPLFLCRIEPSASDPAVTFSDAYQRYAEAIYRHCLLQGLRTDDAEEVMQDAFMRTWEYLKAGNTVGSMKTFLYRVADNLVIDQIRRKKRKEELSLDMLREKGFDPAATDTLKDLEEKFEVWRLLKLVEEREYTLLQLRFVDGLTPQQIAEKMGVSRNNVAVQLHRTIKKMSEKVSAQRKRRDIIF